MPTPTVKALVVHSPYAQQIANGEKGIEYRSWKCTYRGWLAIVAARRRESGADAGRCVCLVKLVYIIGDEGNYEWMLENPVPLNERWEIPGRLGLFAVDPPAFVLSLIGQEPELQPIRPSPKPIAQRDQFLDWGRFAARYH